MKLSAALCLCCVVLQTAGCAAAPESDMPSQLASGVWGVLESPGEAGPCPGVVLLHDAVGWRPELVDLASTLADSGFVVPAMDYYAESERTSIRSSEKLKARPKDPHRPELKTSH